MCTCVMLQTYSTQSPVGVCVCGRGGETLKHSVKLLSPSENGTVLSSYLKTQVFVSDICLQHWPSSSSPLPLMQKKNPKQQNKTNKQKNWLVETLSRQTSQPINQNIFRAFRAKNPKHYDHYTYRTVAFTSRWPEQMFQGVYTIASIKT